MLAPCSHKPMHVFATKLVGLPHREARLTIKNQPLFIIEV